MPTGKRKGISAKIAEKLYDEVKAYAESHEMTMSDFIERSLQNELHPKFNEKEEKNMGNTRTIAFQTSDEIFEKLNDYLHRHGLKKNKFFLDFINKVLEEDQTMQDKQNAEGDIAETEDEAEAMNEAISDEDSIDAAEEEIHENVSDGENISESDEDIENTESEENFYKDVDNDELSEDGEEDDELAEDDGNESEGYGMSICM